jgi:hypothetical protein
MFLSVVINLVTGPTQTQRNVDSLLPGYGWVWYIGVLIGAGLALSACFMGIPTCLLIERIGLVLLSALLTGYSIVAIIVLGLVGFSGAFFLLMFSAAGVARIFQINSDVHILKNLGGGDE